MSNGPGISIRVQRTAGEASDALKRLGADAAAAKKEVSGVDAALADLQRRRDEYRRTLADIERNSAPDDPRRAAAQAELSRLDAAIAARRSAVPPGMQPAPPTNPAVTPVARPASRPLTPEERKTFGNRYSEAELNRARWLSPPTDTRPGTLIFDVEPPRPSAAPRGAVGRHIDDIVPPGSQAGAPPPAGASSTGGGAVPPTPSSAVSQDDEAASASNTASQYADLGDAKRRSALSDRELQKEWAANQKALNAEYDAIARVEKRLESLRHGRTRVAASLRQQLIVQGEAELRDRRQSLNVFHGDARGLRAEAERRGFQIGNGGTLVDAAGNVIGHPTPGAGGGGGGALGQFGQGLASGGGGWLGYGMGLLRAHPFVAAGTAVGALGAYALSSGGRANDLARRVFDAGMRSGGGWQDIYDQSMSVGRGSYYLHPEEMIEARLAFGTRTGRTDALGIAAFARAYGMSPGSTASMIGQVGTLGVLPRERTGRSMPGRLPTAPQPTAAPRPQRADGVWGFGVGRYGERGARGESGSWRAPYWNDPSAPDWIFSQGRYTLGDRNPTSTRTQVDVNAPGFLERMLGHASNAVVLSSSPHGGLPASRRVLAPHTATETPSTSERAPSVSGGIASILARAYQGSAYRGLPEDRRNLLAESFVNQWARLSRVQSSGGRLIQNWEAVPAMLATATRFFGPDVSPEMPAARVGAFMEGIQRPKGEVLQGIQLRGIHDLASSMTPEQIEEFRRATATGKNGRGGIDLRKMSGRVEAMQNTFSLPPEQQAMILRAQIEGRRRVTGGGEAELWMLAQAHTGGQLGPARDIQELQNKLMNATLGSQEEQSLMSKIREQVDKSGRFGTLFGNDLGKDHLGIEVSEPIKALGQSITSSVLDLADSIVDALNYWDREVGVRGGH